MSQGRAGVDYSLNPNNMRCHVFICWAILFLSSCLNTPNPQAPNKLSCEATILRLVKNGNDVYYNVVGFDTANVDCFDYLVKWGAGAQRKYNEPGLVFHFLDNLPDFKPQNDGKMYGSKEVQDKVILQYIVKMTGDTMLAFSPFGLSKYYPPSSKIIMGSTGTIELKKKAHQ
jgi:hypothetical protein